MVGKGENSAATSCLLACAAIVLACPTIFVFELIRRDEKMSHDGCAGHSPIRLAAAQTLYDIATNSPRKNPHDMIKWPKKSSQKAMKARKLLPVKKPRLSINEKSNGLGHAHTVRKVPVTWAARRSCRSSSPTKLLRDSVVEPKHYSPDIVKQSSVMPPSTRVLDKACNGQQKLRRLAPMERNWSGGKLD